MLILCVVPVGIAAALFQASIYDVPGGYRAVMFDRFSGVKDKVSPGNISPNQLAQAFALRLHRRAHIS